MTSKLIKNGRMVLYGTVGGSFWDDSGFTDTDVIDALAEMSGDITVSLNSPGGQAFMGIAIYNALKRHDGKVAIEIDALAASAASVIAMAGDHITMMTGAMMMIHDPSGITFGTAKDHRKSAESLEGLAISAADIYAARTGMDVADILPLMSEETWMTAADAVEMKFADVAGHIDRPTEMAFPAFDYSLFARTPDQISASASNRAKAVSLGNRPANVGPLEKEVAMSANSPAPVLPATETSIKDVTQDIFSRCRSAKLTMDQTDEVIRLSSGDSGKARDLIIDMMADRDALPEITNSAPARVTADASERFREGVSRSLMSKSGLAGGEVNEFSSMSLRELARASLNLRGDKTVYRDPLAMAAAAMSPIMSGGSHASSDFVHALANVANKSMLKGWDESEETFQKWTAAGTLPDFKPGKRIDLNLFPALAEVVEGGEYTYASIGDRGETIQLATYGKKFSITRQAIINDDMSVFTRIPGRMGRAARRTIGNLVYAVLTGNPAMSDGTALFHATHGNLLSAAALSIASFSAARTAMAKQKDPDGHAKSGLNIRPAYLLVPTELRDAANVLMTSEFSPGETQRVPNAARSAAEVIDDARLSDASATAWYLAASAAAHDTIEVAYLNGIQQPTLEQRDGWDVDGTEFKVRIDAGVKALDFRGLTKNAGA